MCNNEITQHTNECDVATKSINAIDKVNYDINTGNVYDANFKLIGKGVWIGGKLKITLIK